MPYLLDTNVFITAKNLHYGLDFCPAFWDWLVETNASGTVFSIEKVADEIVVADDQLAEWAEQIGENFFLKPDQGVLAAMGRVAEWVTTNGYEPAAVNTFLQCADYYLISHAFGAGFTVVTHERPAETSKKVKIPNVCIGLKIKVMTPFEMLRSERARFVLGTQGA